MRNHDNERLWSKGLYSNDITMIRMQTGILAERERKKRVDGELLKGNFLSLDELMALLACGKHTQPPQSKWIVWILSQPMMRVHSDGGQNWSKENGNGAKWKRKRVKDGFLDIQSDDEMTAYRFRLWFFFFSALALRVSLHCLWQRVNHLELKSLLNKWSH